MVKDSAILPLLSWDIDKCKKQSRRTETELLLWPGSKAEGQGREGEHRSCVRLAGQTDNPPASQRVSVACVPWDAAAGGTRSVEPTGLTRQDQNCLASSPRTTCYGTSMFSFQNHLGLKPSAFNSGLFCHTFGKNNRVSLKKEEYGIPGTAIFNLG